MHVTLRRAQYIPALNSYFIEDFTQQVKAEILRLRNFNLGGDKRLSKNVWEVSKEVWKYLEKFPHTFEDLHTQTPNQVVLEINEDDLLGKYHYQQIAADMLRDRPNCLLFFDTGTGKTRTTLLALSRLSKELDAAIVVGESSKAIAGGWLGQTLEYFPQMSDRLCVLTASGSLPQRTKMVQEAPKGTIFIFNIESVRNQAFLNAINSRNLAVCVLDECQCIIGANAQQTAGMQALRADYRWALSATPIKNSPLEWYSLMAWLRVIPFDGEKTRFKDYYGVKSLDKWGKIVYRDFRNEVDLEELKNLVSIRVQKKGLGLPPRTIIPIEVPKDTEYTETLRKISKERRKDDIDAVFNLLGKEFEAKNTSDLFYIERLATSGNASKIQKLLEMASEPSVIVSCLKAPLDYIHSLMPEQSVLYHGDIPEQERVEGKRAFIAGEKKLFLMTRKSGGTGLDGLQKVCRTMFVLDAPENKANLEQCLDRLHRIGQEREVFIYLLKVQSSLDFYAWDNMEQKQDWIDRYFEVNYEEDRL